MDQYSIIVGKTEIIISEQEINLEETKPSRSFENDFDDFECEFHDLHNCTTLSDHVLNQTCNGILMFIPLDSNTCGTFCKKQNTRKKSPILREGWTLYTRLNSAIVGWNRGI